MKKKAIELIRITIYIWMGLQIVLGLVWAFCNLGELPRFVECQEVLTMSDSLVVDEYTGYLYPLLIRGISMLVSGISISAWTVLYILQLIVAYVAYDYFLRKVIFRKSGVRWRFRKKLPIYAMFLLTIPMVLQVHMAVLPYSLASSLLLLLVAKVPDFWNVDYRMPTRDWVGMLLLWILSSQICVEYAWFGGLALGIGVLGSFRVRKENAWKSLIIVVIGVLSINLLNMTLQTPGSMGKIQKSWQSSMMTRVLWPNYGRFSYFWTEEIRQSWDDNALRELSTHPENVIYEFGPDIEEMYGREEANFIYFEMAKRAFQLDTKNILVGILKDGGAYLCPPVSVYMQLQGIGTSYTGWNYGRMKDYSPQLTGCYVDCALFAWLYVGLAGLMLWIFCTFPKEWKSKEEKVERSRMLLYGASISLSVNLGYVIMSGNMQDYKKVILCSVFCTLLLIAMLIDAEEKGLRKDGIQ